MQNMHILTKGEIEKSKKSLEKEICFSQIIIV